jgi:peptidyl-prolyl cis-trans isomerase D
MLDNIRTRVKGPWAIAIVVVISIPFVMFGVESLFSVNFGNSDPVKVNGESISEQHIQNRVNQGIASNPSVSPGVMRKQVIQSLVNQRVFEDAARDVGLSVPTSLIDEEIMSIDSFQENGKFSQARFDQVMQANNLQASNYREYVKKDIMVDHMKSQFDHASFVTDQEIINAFAYLKQKRNISTLSRTLDHFKKNITPAEESIQLYFDTVKDQYVTEDKVILEYIKIDKDLNQIKVDDSEIRERYNSEVAAANLKSNVKKRIAHIMLKANDNENPKKQLKALRKEIVSGVSFEEIAKKHSQDPGSKDQGGDLGFVDLQNFPEEFIDAASELKVGEISQPVVTTSGVHLIKLIDEKTTTVSSYEDRYAVIKAGIQATKSNDKFQKTLDSLADSAFNADDLSEPAKEFNLTIRETKAFSKTTAYNDITKNSEVIKAAFSQDLMVEKNNSDIIQLSPSSAIVIRVKQDFPSQHQELKDVRKQVVEQYKASMAKDQAVTWQNEVLKQIEEGVTLSDIASKAGVTLKSYDNIAMDDYKKISPSVLRTAFQIVKPKDNALSAKSLLESNESHVIVVKDVTLSDTSNISEQDMSSIKRLLENYLQNNQFQMFSKNIYDAAKIIIRESEQSDS